MANFRLVFNNKAFPAIRHLGVVVDRANGAAKEIADDATSAAQSHGGGQYGWESGGNADRHIALAYTGDTDSALDSALHGTLYMSAAKQAGR